MTLPGVRVQRTRLSKLRRQEAITSYVFLTPYIVGLLVFLAGPLVYSAWLSFTRYDILSPPRLVGLDNYRTLFSDPLFWQSLKVTSYYSVVSVPGQVVIGYSLALLLNLKVRGLSFWRTLYYVPAIVPSVPQSISLPGCSASSMV